MKFDIEGRQVPNFKEYIRTYVPNELPWKIKPWFKIDLEKLRDWYQNLEQLHNNCKFIYGDNFDVWDPEPIGDPTGRTGHIIPDKSAWYVLSFAGEQTGALPPVAKHVKPQFKEQWVSNDLNPRYCFYGYGLEIVQSMPASVKKIQISEHAPGHELLLHQDSPDNIRFHIAIETNRHCWWEIQGERFQIPANGWVYLINTSLPHRVYNRGNSPRIHLYGKVSAEDIINNERSHS